MIGMRVAGSGPAGVSVMCLAGCDAEQDVGVAWLAGRAPAGEVFAGQGGDVGGGDGELPGEEVALVEADGPGWGVRAVRDDFVRVAVPAGPGDGDCPVWQAPASGAPQLDPRGDAGGH